MENCREPSFSSYLSKNFLVSKTRVTSLGKTVQSPGNISYHRQYCTFLISVTSRSLIFFIYFVNWIFENTFSKIPYYNWAIDHSWLKTEIICTNSPTLFFFFLDWQTNLKPNSYLTAKWVATWSTFVTIIYRRHNRGNWIFFCKDKLLQWGTNLLSFDLCIEFSINVLWVTSYDFEETYFNPTWRGGGGIMPPPG